MSMIQAAFAPTSLVHTETPSAETSAPVATGAIVLIVADSPVDRRLASAIVARRSGLRPITAAGGEDALDMIARRAPSVVVTDLQMPGMNGLELVEEIRNHYPGLPVALMTAYGSEDIAIQALRAGAANYVPQKALDTEPVLTLDTVLTLAAFDGRRKRLLRCVETCRSSYRLDNDPELISPLIAVLQEDLSGLGICDNNSRTRVGVALQEALSNAMYHGNLEVSSDLRQEDERLFYAEADTRRRMAPYRNRVIHVTADLDREAATYRICDEGPGFDTAVLDAPFDPESLMRVGGRGMILIRSFMDEVKHNGRGNEITLIKRKK